MSWSTSELRARLVRLNRFKPSSKIFCWPFQGGTSFVDLLCFCFVLCLLFLCASVYMCFVVTCWEGADLLALVCGVCCEFVTFPLVSWVRCGTWLYRFLIFAPLLTLTLYLIETPFNVSANRADPDQAALVRAAWSGSTLFAYGYIIYLIHSRWTWQ